MEPVPNRAPKLVTGGSLDDLLDSYAAVKSHSSAKYQARKNDTRLAGEKKHSHSFHIDNEQVDDRSPYHSYSIPCGVEGCTAELHPTETGSEVFHNGAWSTFKGQVERD